MRAGERPRACLADHIVLLKPRVMSLVVFTGAVGFLLAPGRTDWLLLAVTLAALAAGAGACGALNMWWDGDIDRCMARTAARPIPRGVVQPAEALSIGLVLSVLSVAVLASLANILAASLLLLTIVGYVPLYTVWLKRRTPLNIVIGGAAGALPPVIGWAAATGGVDAGPIALFLIIFLWTPPHFWSLAICRRADYERAGVPMMPNVIGVPATCRQILVYCLLLLPVSFAPLMIAGGSALYALTIAVLDAVLMWRALALYRLRNDAEARPLKAAMALFRFSILYMLLLFVALLVQAVTQ
jgi:protoheme IX farnesyltransferase